jgi:hypothetical protein
MTGSFTSKANAHSLALSDQPNHELNIAEISGVQKCSDAHWNDVVITYWAVTDTVDGKGTQRGYFAHDHGGDDREWGTFEGRVVTSGAEIKVEGTFHFSGGSGKFKGLSGGGAFQSATTSPTAVGCTWRATYELTIAKAHAG